ncbi:Hypothetical predicted protein [Paramuricea clavata]|nr:Hypothetical predicted protein [Paramuricea clavata]
MRGHWDHKHYLAKPVIENVIDFEIQDVYLFATKKSNNGIDLYVGYHYHDISKAEFPNTLRTEDYVIADASEGQVFVAVNHNKNTSHLYISDVNGKKYTLSMERVLLYSPNLQQHSWLRYAVM